MSDPTIKQVFLPEHPTQFDYLHAIRALASRAGQTEILELADKAMNMDEVDGETPETDAHVKEINGCQLVLANTAKKFERQRNKARAQRDALAAAGRELDQILPGNGPTAHPAVQAFRTALVDITS